MERRQPHYKYIHVHIPHIKVNIMTSYFSNPLYSNRKFVGRPGTESEEKRSNMQFSIKQLTVCVVSGDILSSFTQMVLFKFSATEFVPETSVQPTHEWHKLDNRCCSHFKRPSPTPSFTHAHNHRALIAKRICACSNNHFTRSF